MTVDPAASGMKPANDNNLITLEEAARLIPGADAETLKRRARQGASNDSELTAERLREVLSYNAETGIFTWLVSRGKARVGDVAGKHACNGYWRIKLYGKEYPAHRLAWLYVYGAFPDGPVDHINLDKIDNRIANLREATLAENQHNKSEQKNNTSGFKGVSRLSKNGRWRAEIMLNGKSKYLGSFRTAEEAADAYSNAAVNLHADFARDASGSLVANDNAATLRGAA